MKRFILSKRGFIALATLAVAAAAATAAYAYFTTTGSGTGSASVGSSSALTITQTNTISGLAPGAAAKSVEYTINNPSGKGDQNLGKVSVSVSAVYDPTNSFKIDESGTNACPLANFSGSTAGTAVGTIADGATFDSTLHAGTEPTVSMVE